MTLSSKCTANPCRKSHRKDVCSDYVARYDVSETGCARKKAHLKYNELYSSSRNVTFAPNISYPV